MRAVDPGVVVFSLYGTPVIHLPKPWDDQRITVMPNSEIHENTTVCGQVLHWFERRDGKTVDSGNRPNRGPTYYLPMSNADKFGRRCKRCWPPAPDRCALCGHDPACGHARDGELRLCHAGSGTECSIDHLSCYVRWTVYGSRPPE